MDSAERIPAGVRVPARSRTRQATAAYPPPPAVLPHAPLPRAPARPCASGKFLFVAGEKLHVRGATYGTFRPNRDGELFPSPSVVARDFATMAEHGFNALRTYTIPPHWLLDAAAEHGLYVMAGIAWEQHVDFLARRRQA